MKRGLLIWLAVTLTIVVILPQANALDSQKVAKEKYDRALRQVLQGDLKVDWKEFRLAAEVGEVYGDFDWHPVRDHVLQELNSGDYKQALAGAQKIVSHNFADPEGHLLAMMAYRKLEQRADAEREHSILDQIVQSILSSADGKIAATAYFTVNVSEEYFLIRVVWGASQKSQALVNLNGHAYDEMTIEDRSGKEQKVWFNTDTDVQKMAAAFHDDKGE